MTNDNNETLVCLVCGVKVECLEHDNYCPECNNYNVETEWVDTEEYEVSHG